MVQRLNISYTTQITEGTKAIDTLVLLIKCMNLGVETLRSLVSTKVFKSRKIIFLPDSNADTFMSLVATISHLGISFFEYVRDRISYIGNILSV
jgi:hypothetical protein